MFSVRPAVPDDAELIHRLIVELARYEKAEASVKATTDEIRRSIFDANSNVSAFIGEWDNLPVAYAVCFENYSTWLGKSGLYLEDLYVSPAHRGRGTGLALMKYLARHAVSKGCERFEWSVLDWNTPAIDFYQSIGAKSMDEWISYRLEGGALTQFAED